MFRLGLLAIAICAGLLAGRANAQIASLLADSVVLVGDDTIVATGNVEILVDGSRLKAAKITYDATTDRLIIQGPITLQQGDNLLFLASSAELDGDLENGFMLGARLILARRLQIAAAEIDRVDGRFTRLSSTIASSCKISSCSLVPLWQIRAKQIIHDAERQQLFFENAQLRVYDIPVFFLPRLRIPDPTLKRSTGFLIPSYRTSSRLGTGVRLPYFVAINDYSDVTITPFISPETTTIGARYREAYRTGRLQFDGALTRDSLLPGETRFYLFGNANFNLPRDFDLQFDFELTSDPAYLLEYGFSDNDRLQSEIALTRTRAADYFNAGLIRFETLRGSELAIDDQLPNFQGEVFYERRFFPQALGGQGSWALGAEAHSRSSSLDGAGRDVAHFRGRLKWSRSETFGPGFVGRIGTDLAADLYQIAQDSSFSPSLAYLTPAVEAELRWPLTKTARDGAAIVLEPVVHLAWTTNLGAAVPNEDSTLVEFDEGNLLAISRFPGEDRFETGGRATVGLKWTRYDPAGWSLALALGRVVRDDDAGQFTAASGLDGRLSDWLVAGQVKLNSTLSVTGRALISDGWSLTKAETRLGWRNQQASLAATYSRIVPDLAENRPNLTSQMTLDASYNIRRHWTGNLTYRYDFDAEKSTRAEIGVKYANECFSFDISFSRRFTSSTSVAPTTDFGLSVNLLGLGSGAAGPERTCGR